MVSQTVTHHTSKNRGRILAGLPVKERRLRLNGIGTAVLEGGDGPPIVLLHGPEGHAPLWRPIIPGLVARHRVIAPDLPGYGSSDPVTALELTPDRLFGWLDDLIECTCPEPPVLVGDVLGGAIAAHFACDRSDRIKSLVLVNTLGLEAFQPPPDFGQVLQDYLTDPSERTHDALWSNCAFDYDAMRRRMGTAWDWISAYNVERGRTPSQQALLPGLIEQFGRPIPPEDLRRIAVPTTLIWGRHHRPTPLSVAEAASLRYSWPLHAIDNASDPFMEQPEAFLDALFGALATSKRKED